MKNIKKQMDQKNYEQKEWINKNMKKERIKIMNKKRKIKVLKT